jgi:predicted esterase
MMSRRIAIVAMWLLCLAAPAFAADEPQKDELGRDYFVYTPARIDPKRTYWLVVGVHGFGGDGKGAAGIAAWAKRGDCIVVGPSFPNEGYQLLQKQADEQLAKLFDLLKKRYTLHPKLFIYGLSGGSQFAHRFMMKYPELVAGCSAHSGGTWATGGFFGDINPAAAGIPFVMSCGEADTQKSNPNAPMGRLEWAKAFERKIADAGFCFAAKYWPGVGHGASPGVAKMTDECYRLATTVVPSHEKSMAMARDLIRAGKKKEAAALLGRVRSLLPRSTTGLAKAVADRQAKDLAELERELAGQP